MALAETFSKSIQIARESGSMLALNQVITTSEGSTVNASDVATNYALTLVENGCVQNNIVVFYDPNVDASPENQQKSAKAAFEQAAGGVIVIDGVKMIEPLLQQIDKAVSEKNCVVVLVGEDKTLGTFHDRSQPLQTRFPSKVSL